MENEFFSEANTDLHWRKCFTKSEMSNAFQELYLDAIRRISSQTKSDNPDTIYGTSPGFMQKLQHTFISDIEDINETTKTMTGREINAYLFYLLEPKSLLDLFFFKKIFKPSIFFLVAFSPPIASIAIVSFFSILID